MVGQILQITPEVFSLLQEFTVMRINTRVSRTLKVRDSTNGSEHLSYEESLRKLGMFSPQKRRHRGNVINVYTNQMGGWKEERAMLLSVVTSDRTKAVGINWNIGGFLWMSRNIFFYFERNVPPWTCSTVFWTWLWAASSSWPCLSKGTIWPPEVPSNLHCDSVILWSLLKKIWYCAIFRYLLRLCWTRFTEEKIMMRQKVLFAKFDSTFREG